MTTETVQTALSEAAAQLAAAGIDTPALDAAVLLAHTLDKDRAWLLTWPQTALTAAQSRRFADLLQRRLRREPVAYLLGRKEFFGLEFTVTPAVLIPRPETELLVETALEWAAARPGPLTVADVGTGSGCMAVSLACHLPQARLFALDISAGALAVARRNADRHAVASRLTFLNGDLLAPLPQPVDLIVSNPPYVSPAELASPAVSPEACRYEPRLALDGGDDDGLTVIRRLLVQAVSRLNPAGALLIEAGYRQGPALLALAHTHFPYARIYLKQDLAGLGRLLVVETAPAV